MAGIGCRGAQPRWRRDGKELFYLSIDMKVMSVEVRGGGGSFEAGRPQTLFQRPQSPIGSANFGPDYDVTADGQRFLANTSVDAAGTAPITVVVNWTATLKR